ncbi:carbohydrate ABC transporter permease [Caldanaerobius polysaccharolyticus]|nr:sugar ABC transporter permease [Caldanaerobius polysaccharolyticus]
MSLEREEAIKGVLFISPWIIGFLVFTLYPFISSFYYSFTRFGGIGTPVFIGLKNYVNLFHDKLFYLSLYNTLYYTVIAVPLGVVLGIAVALLLNQKIRGLSFFRTIIYMPYMVPTVASAILWMWILDPQFGLINSLLASIGIKGPGWLADPAWSKMSLIIMAQWGMGQAVVIYLSGLRNVPTELYESADIDGANIFQKFFHVTLPMMSPVILYNVILGVINSLQYFTQAYIMTSGGPVNSTLFYSLYLFRESFMNYHMGYASAMAWILLVIIAACVYLLFKTSAKYVYYSGE